MFKRLSQKLLILQLIINLFNAQMSSFLISYCRVSGAMTMFNGKWRNECVIFFYFFLSAMRDRVCEICSNNLKGSWSRSFINWQLTLWRVCYLSQFRNPALLLDSSHCVFCEQLSQLVTILVEIMFYKTFVTHAYWKKYWLFWALVLTLVQ